MQSMRCLNYRKRLEQEELVRSEAQKLAKCTYDKGYSIPYNMAHGAEKIREATQNPESQFYGADAPRLVKIFREEYKSTIRELKPRTIVDFGDIPKNERPTLKYECLHPTSSSCVFSYDAKGKPRR